MCVPAAYSEIPLPTGTVRTGFRLRAAARGAWTRSLPAPAGYRQNIDWLPRQKDYCLHNAGSSILVSLK